MENFIFCAKPLVEAKNLTFLSTRISCSEVSYQKVLSGKFHKTHRKTSAMASFFSKVAGQSLQFY